MIDRSGQRLDRFFDDGPSGGTSDGLAAALARTRTVNQRRGFGRGLIEIGNVRLSLRAAVVFTILAVATAGLAVAGARLVQKPLHHESILLSVDEVLTAFDPLDPKAAAVAVADEAEHIEYPSYSRDGSKVAFWSTPTFNDPLDLVVADADLTDRHVLAVARTYRLPTPIAWSPDGTRLAVEGNDVDGTSRVYVVGIDGTGWTAIAPTLDVHAPAWSSDGLSLAMLGADYHEGVIGIYVADPDGTDVHSIVQSSRVDWLGQNLSGFSWSPDDRAIAFTWYGDETFLDGTPFATTSTFVAVVDVATGERRALTGGATDVSPVWSPDGQRIAFVRTGDDQVMTIRPDGTDLVGYVTEVDSDSVTWAPDGSSLALAVVDGGHRLVIVSMDGTVPRYTGITGVVGRPTWTSLP